MLPHSGQRTLVIGAASAIAGEIISQSLVADEELEVIAVSRLDQDYSLIAKESRLQWLQSDYSQSALDMLMKTAAIEYSRRAKQIRFLLFHPGTVATPLSKPFQKSVPSEKLFTAEFVARQLLGIVQNLRQGESIQYLDWDGKSINW